MQRRIAYVLVAVLVSSAPVASSDRAGQRCPPRGLTESLQRSPGCHVDVDNRATSPVIEAANAGGQVAGGSRPAAGSSRIRGRVLIADTKRPARRALVRLTSPDTRDPRTTLTDLDGRYELTNLPRGSYAISASKNGFLGLSYGQTRPSMPPQTLHLGEQQVVDGIDLVLFRGGAISGRVEDEFGDPLTNASVTVMRPHFQHGRRRLIAVAQRASTNDLGEYRIFALPPGSYYVSAMLPPNPPQVENGVQLLGEDPGGLAPVFYPATTEPSAAAKVKVAAGGTVSDVNITLVAARLSRVSGIAIGPRGPIASGSVHALPRGMAQNGSARSSPLKADGHFRLTGLPPGEYTLVASSRVVAPDTGGSPVALPRPDVATGTVVVDGNDVEHVRLAPLAPVTVSGRVKFDNPVSAASVSASAVRVSWEALTADDAMAALLGGATTPQADFSFALQLPPTLVMPRVSVAAGGATTWSMKAVYVNGVEVTERGIALRPGEGASEVVIELTDRPPEVQGTVSVGNAPAPGYTVIVFPEDQHRWTRTGPSLFQSTRTDANGRFSMTGFLPGRFYAIAVSQVDEGGWTDPEFLDAAARRASAFSLAVGEKKVLNLRGQSQ